MADISQININNTDYNFADDTKVPYDLLQDTVGWTSKNLIDVYLPSMNGQSDTINGITYTVNASDKSYNLNGTVTDSAGAFIPPKPSYDDFDRYAPLPKGTYRIVCTNDKNISFYYQVYHKVSKTSAYVQDTVSNDGLFTFADNYAVTWVRIRILNNTVVDNANFKFMVIKADVMDDTYEQYNPSVKQVLRELTEIQNINLSNFFTDSDITNVTDSFIRKIGRVVIGHLQFRFAKTTINTDYTIATLPIGFRPFTNVPFSTSDTGSGSTIERHDCYVSANGGLIIVLRNTHSADRWMMVNFMYFIS